MGICYTTILKSYIIHTFSQCQEYINDVEGQHDILEKQIAELENKILPDVEMLFYYGCKADSITENAFLNGVLVLSSDYLKGNNFPAVFLMDKDFDGISTTNYKLIKEKGTGNFLLTKNQLNENN